MFVSVSNLLNLRHIAGIVSQTDRPANLVKDKQLNTANHADLGDSTWVLQYSLQTIVLVHLHSRVRWIYKCRISELPVVPL